MAKRKQKFGFVLCDEDDDDDFGFTLRPFEGHIIYNGCEVVALVPELKRKRARKALAELVNSGELEPAGEMPGMD